MEMSKYSVGIRLVDGWCQSTSAKKKKHNLVVVGVQKNIQQSWEWGGRGTEDEYCGIVIEKRVTQEIQKSMIYTPRYYRYRASSLCIYFKTKNKYERVCQLKMP